MENFVDLIDSTPDRLLMAIIVLMIVGVLVMMWETWND